MDVYFEKWFAKLMEDEGGYVNDPQDPGGETKYGVSKRAYPHLDIANLDLNTAKDIAYKDYWQAFPYLPDSPLKAMVADMAYNAGVGTSVKLLQKALQVPADGIFGPLSQAAAASKALDMEVALRFVGARITYYASLKGFNRFGRGWMNRVASGIFHYL